MYEPFFGLNEKPFNLTPDPRYFYLSGSHREALAALLYGVHEKAGLMTLTGPVGVGKTMILASFLDQIKGNSEAASFSGGISGNRIEFLRDLCGALGISPEQDSLLGLMAAIKTFAVEKTGEGRSVVVLVDEAQDLSLDELDHFHHLSNLETPDAKLLQIVLAGTEKLDEELRDKSLEALRQRVAIRCVIEPIKPEETVEYIFHRMRIAGRSSFDLFTDDALWRIVNYSRGVPRLINLVCNQAMIAAYSSGRLPIKEDTVRDALRDIEGGHSGIETGEVVPRGEITRLVEAVSRRLKQGIAHSEGEEDPGPERNGDHRAEIENFDKGEVIIGRRRRGPFFSWFRLRRSYLFKLVLVLSLPVVGVLITIGLLKPDDKEVQRGPVASPEESGMDRPGDSPEDTARRYETPRGGAEETIQNQEVVEAEPWLLALNIPEPEQVFGRGKEVSVRDKDLAGIALEHYGRLDVEMLKTFREKNPQVGDWNSLDETVQIVLPEVPQATNGGADFYTIQVGAFRVEEGASKWASDLAKRGAQNLFLVKGEGKRLTLVCVGVFESGRQSSGSIRRMQDWGFEDAFPIRIQEKRLEDILQPYNASIAQKPE